MVVLQQGYDFVLTAVLSQGNQRLLDFFRDEAVCVSCLLYQLAEDVVQLWVEQPLHFDS